MSTEIKFCFNGCSFTEGQGFPKNQRDNYIYDRLISNKFNFNRTNIAIGGSSNYTIFMRSAQALQSQQYDILCTQWTALNRLWLSPGPDTYYFTNDNENIDYKYRNIYISKKDKKFLKDTLMILNHDYQNIFDLVDYCKILEQLAKLNNTKIIFVNGIIPWESDLIKPLGNNLEESLGNYSKSILDFEHRDDNEIIKFFTQLQKKVSELDQSKWVNIFDSFAAHKMDLGPEGHHPGVLSHQWMADKISTYLTKNQII